MRKPILVGFDPRAQDRAPVDFGLFAARFTGAPLIVAAVERGGGSGDQTDEDLVDDCSAVLQALEAELSDAGVALRCVRLQSTSAARALHDAAAAEDARLLVVGSIRRSALGRVLPGSTAERLTHGAPCPLAVVPQGWAAPPDESLRTVAVAFVDTPEGREALRGACSLAQRASATLRVITVVKEGMRVYSETEASMPARRGKDVLDVEGEFMLQGRLAAERAMADMGCEAQVQIDPFTGDPAEVLIDVSRNVDVLVAGSRGYGPVRAVLLGSVSRRVIAEAVCPVILLPRGVTAPLDALVRETAAPA